MLDQLFESPVASFGFIFIVVVLALLYIANREKSKVAQMRGPKRFSPKWSSGRRHRRRGTLSRARGGAFTPRWNREERGDLHDEPGDSQSPAREGEPEGDRVGQDPPGPGRE